MSDRNDILSKGWNKNRRIGMNFVTFAMVFAMVLVTLGGLGCIGGDDSGADANTNDGGTTDSAGGESQTEIHDAATTSQVLEEMALQFQNKELKPRFYPEGNNIQFVPISNIPSQIIVQNLLITNLRVEGKYLVGDVSNFSTSLKTPPYLTYSLI